MGKWSDLTAEQKARVIKFAIDNGVSDINTIRDTYNIYAEGVHEYKDGGDGKTVNKAQYTPTRKEKVSANVMDWLENIAFGGSPIYRPKFEIYPAMDNPGRVDTWYNGAAQDTYLLSRKEQADVFKRRGYIEGAPGDYGLVSKAVGNKMYPIWQTAPDAAKREDLVFATNEEVGDLRLPESKLIPDPGSHPWAMYINGITGEPFAKEWDLNNYGKDANGAHGSTVNKDAADPRYSTRYKIARTFSNLLDKVGSPVVVTSGFQKLAGPDALYGYKGYDKYDYQRDLNTLLDKSRDYYGNQNSIYPYYEVYGSETPYLTLPELEVRPYAGGGSIHIDPSKKGTFTAAASKHGKSVQAFASQVLAHKENYSPAMVKKANFARNAAGWRRSTGGPLYPFSFGPLPAVRYANGGNLVHKHDWGSFLDNLTKFIRRKPTTDAVETEVQPLDYGELKRRQAYAESGFSNTAKSKAGAAGMFQIMPSVLADYNKANGTSYTEDSLTDQTTNTAIRDWYIDSLSKRPWVTKGGASDSVQFGKALAGYNYGSGNTVAALNKAKAEGIDIYNGWDWLKYMPQETQDYVNFILRNQNNSISRNDSAYRAASLLNSEAVKQLGQQAFGGKLFTDEGNTSNPEYILDENIVNKPVWLYKTINGERSRYKTRPGTVNLQNITDAWDSNGADTQYIWDQPEHETYSAYRKNPDYRQPIEYIEPLQASSTFATAAPVPAVNLKRSDIKAGSTLPSFYIGYNIDGIGSGGEKVAYYNNDTGEYGIKIPTVGGSSPLMHSNTKNNQFDFYKFIEKIKELNKSNPLTYFTEKDPNTGERFTLRYSKQKPLF